MCGDVVCEVMTRVCDDRVCELKQNYWSLMSGVMNAIEVFYVGAGVCYVR